ncbi:MAG: serine/threonine protein kinase [Proteobacteria bacterium]|nr:serine/threonine protein kinase [Pseudomonadota bacterium]
MDLPCRFGRYRLVEKIASGGTAEIYRAQLEAGDGFSKTVAIKRLLPSWFENGELARMLKDEARVLCLLPHQSIVQVQELGSEGGSPFIAMEFVHGIDCARLIGRLVRDRSPMPPGHALYVAEQVLMALDFAHRCADADGRPLGIVHRDVSPSNILLSWSGEVKVTDFGIAKGLHRTERTDAGQIRGKYSYMSPEQARGEPIDARSDLFAAGIVLFEMLAGRRLFSNRCEYETLQGVARAEFDLSAIDGLPPELRALITLALAKAPEGRYQSAGEMLAAVRAASRALGEIGSSLDLAAYLAELFPEEIARERSRSTFRQEGEPTRRIDSIAPHVVNFRWNAPGCAWRAVAMVALLAATTAFAPMPRAMDAAAGEAGAATGPLPAVSGQASSPPPVEGMVAIDSVPSGAAGRLMIDGAWQPIRTPFTAGGIDISNGVSGRVELSLDGHEPVSEGFFIGPESAAFVKSFRLRRSSRATISVSARPWGLVTVPGYAKRREAPLASLPVSPGEHTVEVFHPPTGRSLKGRVSLASGASARCRAIFDERASIVCR